LPCSLPSKRDDFSLEETFFLENIDKEENLGSIKYPQAGGVSTDMREKLFSLMQYVIKSLHILASGGQREVKKTRELALTETARNKE
jgi:hypothetical protein